MSKSQGKLWCNLPVKISYASVFTQGQNLDGQLEALKVVKNLQVQSVAVPSLKSY